MGNKEYSVYVVSADSYSTSYLELDNMVSIDADGETSKEAEEFIAKAEEVGYVYSLSEFVCALNSEELFLDNSWVFISKLYNNRIIL